ncbi:MAG: MOSC domain-containing protein [Candidatus Obscuribacter sp.]|nr:MOSC domain-containing protein [Candidatus Obscuribacter sp.]
MPNLTISSLNIYPVKSLKGISLARMPLSKRGPIFDREWMIVDSKGKFITQREYAKMALIACDLTEWEDIERIETATVLTLTLPDGETIDIPSMVVTHQQMSLSQSRSGETLALPR